MQKGCSVRDGPFFPRVLKKHLTGNIDFTKHCFINFFYPETPIVIKSFRIIFRFHFYI